jgi:cyanophycinase
MQSTKDREQEQLEVPPVYATPVEPQGSLIIIGGHENKEGHRPILEQIARSVRKGKLVVATLASEEPEEQWDTYRTAFIELGVSRVEHLDVRKREELLSNPRLDLLDDAEVLFFAGGDQTKITSRFGGTPLCTRMRERYEQGATIAGTSSGASAMSEVMMAGGDENTSSGTASSSLAAGLGLVPGLIIDQHFAERGRISRLFKAVAQNPRLLGIGIDENTAIVLEEHREFRVLGSGAVYVVDGKALLYSKSPEEGAAPSSMFGLWTHVLSDGDRFDLRSRTPEAGPAEEG